MGTVQCVHPANYLKLDPRQFAKIARGDLNRKQLDGIASLLPEINVSMLHEELTQFAREWPSLKHSTILPENRTVHAGATAPTMSEDNNGQLDEDDNVQIGEECAMDCNCIVGCLRVLVEYNMFSRAYINLYLVYKIVLTLPMTPVCCERSFSHLKMIKTRLRNALSQDNLEAHMLLNLNRQWTQEIDNADIIRKMCDNSTEMARLLL